MAQETRSGNGSNGNGKSEWMRWLVGMALAAIVSYFTAKNALEVQITQIGTREQTRFEEMQRTLSRIENVLERQDERYQQIMNDWGRGVDRRTGEPLPLQRQIDQGRQP